ncbi:MULTISPECIES: HD domain-containing protein [Methylobacterium]|uniref:Metal dependent phosphohydrolase n=2 Tax=Methylobacterium TaxID=407 RepID=A0A0C6FN03_9HYPH|nr:HD domain-containing protein [Methylobacterium aquaticum]BAQ43990.1 metal dependent phosphohydrolase [Methylobacterium aquaticum]
MPALGSIHAIARAVCTFQDRACPAGACPPCLERALRAVRAMREAGMFQAASDFDAWELAESSHRGQQDKAGRPYMAHVGRVNEGVSDLLAGLLGRATHDQFQSIMQAATLHDVVEDSAVTLDDLLLRGFSDDVLDMVRLLTKPPGDTRTYAQRIEDLIASGNLGAILVKLADVEDNGDPARLALLPEDQRGIGERYRRARARLHEAATALGWRDPREQAESAA